jgi:hypothetical protein
MDFFALGNIRDDVGVMTAANTARWRQFSRFQFEPDFHFGRDIDSRQTDTLPQRSEGRDLDNPTAITRDTSPGRPFRDDHCVSAFTTDRKIHRMKSSPDFQPAVPMR